MWTIWKIVFVNILLYTCLICLSCTNNSTNETSALDQENLVVDEHASHNHAAGEHPGDQAILNAETDLDWCAEHSVPESECTKCNPSLIENFISTGDWCAGHELPESHCRLCNPGLTFPQEALLKTETVESLDDQMEITLNFRTNVKTCATDGALIQFAAASTSERTGLSIQQVSTTTRNNTFDAPAQIVFDEAETNVVSSTVAALVSKWIRSPGENVKKGDVLAILQSPEIAELESELIKTQAAFKVQNKELIRHKELLAKSLISTSDYDQIEAQTEQALANFTSAKGMLLSVGLNDADIENLIETKTVSNNFVLRSQSDGMLVERIAKLGELLEAGSAFAMLANPKYMWVEAQLTEQQLRNVENGQMIKYTSDGRGINQVGAEIIWVSRFLDQHTRTGTVRAKIIDPSAKLQAGEFGIVTIIKNYNEPTFLVPKDAVQWEGCCNVVFVKESDLRFRPHKVNLIGRMGEYYQVSDGVSGGDQVVVDGSFLLKTELMKSSIGAGCCGLEPVG